MAPPLPAASGPGERGQGSHLSIAVVTGAHGVHGGLRIKLADPESCTLRTGLSVELWRQGERRACTVQRMSRIPHEDRARLFLAEVRDRDAAEALKGCDIRVRRADLPPLGEKEFYLADVVGHAVRGRRADGAFEELGTVVGVASNGAQDLLEVELCTAGGKRLAWLLPVLPQLILEVSNEAIVVDVPEGMLPEETDQAS